MKGQKEILRMRDAARVPQRKADEATTLAVIEGVGDLQVPHVRVPPRFFGRVPPSSEIRSSSEKQICAKENF